MKGEIAEIEEQRKDDELDSAVREELKRKLGWAEARLGVAQVLDRESERNPFGQTD